MALLMGAVVLSACTSTATADKPVQNTSIDGKTLGLSAQNLVEGECGVFLWAETKPRQFVFFQKQDKPGALYYSDGETKSIVTTDVTSYLQDAGKLALNYQDASGAAVKVKGTYSEEIEGGYRITPATIQVQPKDGWQQIIPVSGVYICR